MSTDHPIQIRGLRVHNLKNLDLDIPRNRLVVVSGVSGSGKSSLAFDTLFAEGQRRYIETFSSYTRQFLERIDRPDADSITNIPPSIAIRQRTGSRNSRSTVGSVTEINDFLRLAYAKIGHVHCQRCDKAIRSDSPQSVVAALTALEPGRELLITFPLAAPSKRGWGPVARWLQADGFIRIVVGDRVVNLDESASPPLEPGDLIRVIVDRLGTGKLSFDRLADSVETAFGKGSGRCDVLLGCMLDSSNVKRDASYSILPFSRHWRCEACNQDYPEPEPRLFNSNNPLGACPDCRGFGDIIDIDMDRVVPDRSKSLRQGAIAPWNAPSYAHELEELLALAGDFGIPVDVPFAKLSQRHLRLIQEGVPERSFGGLRGFFQWLERRKYKMHIRVFLSRWRSYRTCPTCQGRRLQPMALATRLGGMNFAEILALEVRQAFRYIRELPIDDHERAIARVVLEQISNRLQYLDAVGVGYLTLDRPLRTLSGGEAQRVALTKALGSGLVNTLYVLDEPSIGLHERDTHRLIEIVRSLCNRQNSVVIVEHDETILRSADHLIDMGPAAGATGGQVVFQGTLSELDEARTATADFLGGRRRISVPAQRRSANHGWIRLSGASGNNLKHVDVAFPLRLLCVVTGVSGSGKSTLVEQTLHAALCQQMQIAGPRPAAYETIEGAEQIRKVLLVDQSPVGRSSRSNPATYVQAFNEIRRAFAETVEARVHNFGPGHFSFNVDGGRCAACQGQGVQIIDMQFLADISVTCPECGGRRFRREVLDVKYRGKNIFEVLEMSIREAIDFFRGRAKIHAALEPLVSVGLEYLKLGQPADTLSGGEAQRLKLAGHLAEATRDRTMIILDEPTTGLHHADISRLLDCFSALIDAGHSLVVVEHHMDLIKCADWIIDLGPEAAGDGGQVVVVGPPERIAQCEDSRTGRFLRRYLS